MTQLLILRDCPACGAPPCVPPRAVCPACGYCTDEVALAQAQQTALPPDAPAPAPARLPETDQMIARPAEHQL